jgi:hypothetical protein
MKNLGISSYLAAHSIVILRCSPFFTASLEGWHQTQALVAILRDAAQARGSSG